MIKTDSNNKGEEWSITYDYEGTMMVFTVWGEVIQSSDIMEITW